jgi:hypothetical protein
LLPPHPLLLLLLLLLLLMVVVVVVAKVISRQLAVSQSVVHSGAMEFSCCKLDNILPRLHSIV